MFENFSLAKYVISFEQLGPDNYLFQMQYIAGFVEADRSGIYSAMDGLSIGFSEDGSIKHLHDPYTVVHISRRGIAWF